MRWRLTEHLRLPAAAVASNNILSHVVDDKTSRTRRVDLNNSFLRDAETIFCSTRA